MLNFMNKAVNVLLAFFFIAITFFTFFAKGVMRVYPLILVLLIVISILVLYKVYSKIMKLRSDSFFLVHYKKIIVVILLIILLLQIIAAKSLMVNPSWDFGIVLKSASQFANTGNIDEFKYYFYRFPNNISLFFAEYNLFRVANFLKLTNHYQVAIFFNCLFVLLSIYILVKFVEKSFNKKTALFVLLLALVTAPFYSYVSIIYTDTLTMFIPILFLYLFYDFLIATNLTRKQFIIKVILIGFTVFLSVRFKISAVIILIALFMVLFLYQPKLTFKYKSKVFISIIAVFLISNLLYGFSFAQQTVFVQKEIDAKKYPYTHWIMMGTHKYYDLSRQSDRCGGYSLKEYERTNKNKGVPNYQVKKTLNRLRKRGIKRNLSFYKCKSLYTWGDGTYYASQKTSLKALDRNNIIHDFVAVDGDYHRIFLHYSQAMHLVNLLAIVFISIVSFKKNNSDNVLKAISFTVVGLIIFFTLWETRSRYILNYLPIFLLFTVYALDYVSKLHYSELVEEDNRITQ